MGWQPARRGLTSRSFSAPPAGTAARTLRGSAPCGTRTTSTSSADLAPARAATWRTNPACTISTRLEGLDLILEGEAERVVDAPTLEKVAAVYRASGWPAEVERDAFTAPYSAPSAGPPPWYLYRFTFHTATGVATAEPHGATRWRFV